MRTFYKLLAAAALFVPGIALAQSEHRFTHRGATYAYTVTPAEHGRQIIEGRQLTDGSAFRLVVDGERVSGVSGGQDVSFRVPRARRVTLAAN